MNVWDVLPWYGTFLLVYSLYTKERIDLHTLGVLGSIIMGGYAIHIGDFKFLATNIIFTIINYCAIIRLSREAT